MVHASVMISDEVQDGSEGKLTSSTVLNTPFIKKPPGPLLNLSPSRLVYERAKSSLVVPFWTSSKERSGSPSGLGVLATIRSYTLRRVDSVAMSVDAIASYRKIC